MGTQPKHRRSKRAYLIPAVDKIFDAYSHYKSMSASAVINRALYDFFAKMDMGTKEVIVEKYNQDLSDGLVSMEKGQNKGREKTYV